MGGGGEGVEKLKGGGLRKDDMGYDSRENSKNCRETMATSFHVQGGK